MNSAGEPSPETDRPESSADPADPIDSEKPLEDLSATQLYDGPADLPEYPQGRELPDAIAHYRIERLLGQGGMGVVYQAYDEKLKRRVALKLLLGGNHHPDHVARFRAEAEAVARLEHTGIVRVYEVGMHDQQHYIALEFIEGGTLTDWITREQQPPEASAQIFQAMARAIAYAHQNDVVHRDLKPANVLLDQRAPDSSLASGSLTQTEIPGSTIDNGESAKEASSSSTRSSLTEKLSASSSGIAALGLTPKISDFGLAKMLNEDDSQLTQTGAILGTPSYMPPEQATGQTREIGRAADIYSLGATFYVMLTGRPPFVGETPLEVLQLVQNEPPVAPRLLRPGIPRDLETICLKCLEKEPERRYATADLLARDVANFLADRPIEARPVSHARRVALFYRRNRTLCRAVLAMVSVLIVATSYYIYRINHAIGVAKTNEIAANAAADEANRQKEEVARQKEEVTKQKDEVTRQFIMSTSRLLAAKSASIRRDNPIRSLLIGIEALEVTRRAGLPMQGLAYENLILGVAEVGGTPIRGHTESVSGLTISNDGRRLITTSADRTMRIWNLSDEFAKLTDTFHHPDRVNALATSPGTKWIATGCFDRLIRLWDPDTHSAVTLEGRGMPTSSLAMSPDGRWLVSGDERGGVFAWDLTQADTEIAGSRLALNSFQMPRVAHLSFSTDSRWLISAHAANNQQAMGTVLLWDLAGDQPQRYQLYQDRVAAWRGVFSPDSRWLVIAKHDGSLPLWRVADEFTKDEFAFLKGHEAAVRRADFSADGNRLASTDDDGLTIAWDLSGEQPAELLRLREPNGRAIGLALSPNGSHLATSNLSSRIRLWDLGDPGRSHELLAHAAVARQLRFTPDGRFLISADNNYDVRIWSVERNGRGPHPVVLKAHSDQVNGLAIGPDGRFVTTSTDESIRFWQRDGTRETELKPDRAFPNRPVVLNRIAWSPDGEYIAATSNTDGIVRIWDLTFDAPQDGFFALRGHRESVKSVAFRPSDSLLATGGADRTVRLWNLAVDQPEETVQILGGHEMPVTGVAFHPTEKDQLASVSMDGTLRLWNLASAPPQSIVLTPESPVTAAGTARLNAVAFSRNGRWLAASGRNAVNLWDLKAENLAESIQFLGGDYFTSVSFSHDGRRLVCGDTLGQTHLWDLTAENIDSTESILSGHSRWVTSAVFNHDDSNLITASQDGTVRIWELRPDRLLKIARRTAGRKLRIPEYKQFPPEALIPALEERLKDEPENESVRARLEELTNSRVVQPN